MYYYTFRLQRIKIKAKKNRRTQKTESICTIYCCYYASDAFLFDFIFLSVKYENVVVVIVIVVYMLFIPCSSIAWDFSVLNAWTKANCRPILYYKYIQIHIIYYCIDVEYITHINIHTFWSVLKSKLVGWQYV